MSILNEVESSGSANVCPSFSKSRRRSRSQQHIYLEYKKQAELNSTFASSIRIVGSPPASPIPPTRHGGGENGTLNREGYKTILHCITSLDPDGAQQMLLRLVRALPEYQHVVVSLKSASQFAQELERAGATVVSCGMKASAPSFRGFLKLVEYLREYKPDIIQSWLYHANCYTALARAYLRLSTPLLWGIRGSLDSGWERGIKTGIIIHASRFLAHLPTKITFNSYESISQHSSIGYPETKACFVPNGFDIQRFKPDSEVRARVRAQFNIVDGQILIGIIGRDDITKDYNGFLQAISLLIQDLSHVRVIMVGRGVAEPERPIFAAVERLGLKNVVMLQGAHPDISQLLPGFDIYCSSSVTEGFPNVVAEALACGVPCVATNVGMSPRLVESAGEIVPPGQPVALAEALKKLCLLSHTERQNLGRIGRQCIEGSYSLEAMAREY
jgi:glycosyltransferase involved in cell wall biosynthesis